MSNADSRGTFVWHDLLTGDAAGAKAFYTKVVPWKTQTWDQDANYTMWVGKNGPVGGIGPLGDSGAPHWVPHISVPDLAATVEEAKNLGGRVLKEPTTLPNGGSFAVLADPQGAEFSVYQSASELNGASAPGAGDFTWHELATSDAKAAMDFYTQLLGWEAGPVHDMGPAGLYHLFLHKGNQYGGIYVTDNWGGPSWLCYIGVEDAGKAAAAAKAAGGRVLNGPIEVPGGSWVAQVLDSDGAPFAVHEPAKAQAAAAATESAAEAKPAKAPKAAKSKAPKPEKAAAAAANDSDVAPAAAATAEEPKKAAAKPATAAPAKQAAPKSAGTKPAAAKPVKAAATPAAADSAAEAAATKSSAAKPSAKSAAKPAAAPARSATAKLAVKAPAKAAAKGKGKTAKKAAKKAAAKGKARAAVKKSAAGKSKGKKKAAGKKKSAAKRAAPAKKASKAGKKTKAKKRR